MCDYRFYIFFKFQILPFGVILLMSRVNYNAMSDAQLKQYFLKHRGFNYYQLSKEY